MIYWQKNELTIRGMLESDISDIFTAFENTEQRIDKNRLQLYFEEQNRGERTVFVTVEDGKTAGYVTLIPRAKEGPFKNTDIPEIKDFNVAPAFRRKGIGNSIMETVESYVKSTRSIVSLSVGLYADYSSAQRMYCKRGYILDGSGLWYGDNQIPPGTNAFVDDDLVLYLYKSLNDG